MVIDHDLEELLSYLRYRQHDKIIEITEFEILNESGHAFESICTTMFERLENKFSDNIAMQVSDDVLKDPKLKRIYDQDQSWIRSDSCYIRPLPGGQLYGYPSKDLREIFARFQMPSPSEVLLQKKWTDNIDLLDTTTYFGFSSGQEDPMVFVPYQYEAGTEILPVPICMIFEQARYVRVYHDRKLCTPARLKRSCVEWHREGQIFMMTTLTPLAVADSVPTDVESPRMALPVKLSKYDAYLDIA